MGNGCKWRVWKEVLTVWTILGDVANGEPNSSSLEDKTHVENGWKKWWHLTLRMQSLNKYLQFDGRSFQRRRGIWISCNECLAFGKN